ncbi:MAG TPA: hypothetical protein EYP49_03875 [Anaerolineae bacterium]|nr:hypothetical protein [Anaerolineae bacterium]
MSVAFLSIFSGPMANLGLPTQLGLPAGEVERVGRIIMVYRQPGQEVGWTLPLIDIGIGLFFIAMVIFVGERLIHSSIEGVK